jgi:hypothetical protein
MSQSTGVASGVVIGIRLMIVIVLQRFLRAVMMGGYRIRQGGSGLWTKQERIEPTDLLNVALVKF